MATTSSAREGPFTVRTDENGDSLVIRAVGELDIATSPMLEASLRDAFERDASSIHLDVADVSFIDSMGLRVLLWAAAHSRGNGDALRIRCGSGVVRKMLEVTRTEGRLSLLA